MLQPLLQSGRPLGRAQMLPQQMSFADESFDFIISSAVLYFAEHEKHFDQMVYELWRVLKPGGRLFARLVSSNGMESSMQPLSDELCFLMEDIPISINSYIVFSQDKHKGIRNGKVNC